MNPVTASRRSFVERRVTHATKRQSPGGQPSRESKLKLIDLSVRLRWGLKGRDTLAYLKAAGAVLPSDNNKAHRQRDSSLLARLSPGEALILSSLHTGRSVLARSIESLPPEGRSNCYPVPRQDSHCWFIVTGPDAPVMFAKLCAVNLVPDRFIDGSVAQTNLARLAAIIIRHDITGRLAYSVLADSASAEYLWDCLVDAMSEFSAAVFESVEAAEQQPSGSRQ